MAWGLSVTEQEAKVASMLGAAWNAFLELPIEHPSDRTEFCQALHQAQNIVLSRSGRRELIARDAAA